MHFQMLGLDARLNNSICNPQDFFLLFDAEPEVKSPLFFISSKGCEFQKPEQVAEMGERGRVEAVISD